MEFRDNIFEKFDTVEDYRVFVILGDSALLTNYAITALRNRQVSSNKLTKLFAAMNFDAASMPITDVKTDSTDTEAGLAVCGLEELWKRPGRTMSGKWWCVASYDGMSKKDRINFQNYLKNPSKNAILILTVSDWKLIREIKKNSIFKSSTTCHILNIQYPSKFFLTKIVNELFLNHKVQLTKNQQYVFITKMSSAYDEYRDCVEEVCENIKINAQKWNDTELNTVTDKELNEATKTIEHFEIDDLLRFTLQPLSSGKTLNGKRKIHKLLAKLLEDNTAKDICNRLKYRVKDMLIYRAAVNKGLIPVTVPYNAASVQEKLPDTQLYEKIKKAPLFTFKRNAYISSQTSIEDWFFIYSMLESIPKRADEAEYMRVLLSIVNRTALSNDRLMNDIKIKNTLDEGLVYLNGIFYSNWWKSLDKLEDLS